MYVYCALAAGRAASITKVYLANALVAIVPYTKIPSHRWKRCSRAYPPRTTGDTLKISAARDSVSSSCSPSNHQIYQQPDRGSTSSVSAVAGLQRGASIEVLTSAPMCRYMARDEMNTITEDRWDEDVWGAAQTSTNGAGSGPKLYFYFGKEVYYPRKTTSYYLLDDRLRIGSLGCESHSRRSHRSQG